MVQSLGGTRSKKEEEAEDEEEDEEEEEEDEEGGEEGESHGEGAIRIGGNERSGRKRRMCFLTFV